MMAYHPVDRLRGRYSPSVRTKTGMRIVLGQDAMPTNVTPANVKLLTGAAGVAGLALAGVTAWVGIHTGIKSRGMLRIAGWAVAGAALVAGAIDLMGTLGIVLMTNTELQKAIDKGKQPPVAAPANPAPALVETTPPPAPAIMTSPSAMAGPGMFRRGF